MIKIILVAASVALLMSCEKKPYSISKTSADVDQLTECVTGGRADFDLEIKARIYWQLREAGTIDAGIYESLATDLGELHKFRCLKKFLLEGSDKHDLLGDAPIAEHY